jgi:hypothetical protein
MLLPGTNTADVMVECDTPKKSKRNRAGEKLSGSIRLKKGQELTCHFVR